MNCNDIQDRLDDFLDGELASAQSDAFGAHVAECSSCREMLSRAQTLAVMMPRVAVEPPPDGFDERVLQRAAEQTSSKPRISRIAVGSFVAACAASVLTIALMGPFATAPTGNVAEDFPVVAMTVDQPQTVNLVFASNSALQDVSLRVELPQGVELAGYAGRREVVWRTSMQAGKNVLPLELVADHYASGEIVARLQHGDMEQIFRISVSAAAS